MNDNAKGCAYTIGLLLACLFMIALGYGIFALVQWEFNIPDWHIIFKGAFAGWTLYAVMRVLIMLSRR